MRVRILGGDSDKWRSIEDGLQKEQARHAARTKGDTDWRYEDKLLVQAIADAILDWDGFVDELDEAIPCENDNKLLLLTTHRWVFEQINGVIKDRTRFMPGGEQS